MQTPPTEPGETSNQILDDNLQDQSLPLPIQIFLWRQISPFIRPKLGKHHEATCMFCQQAPGHHELKEACKSFEKVLVQNIQYGLSLALTDGVTSIPRWRFIQAAFPHVMQCAANLLQNRKETQLQNLGATETKILYTLHWIILLAADECADEDREKGLIITSPFHYLFSIPSITLFVYLFAPIFHHLKESDFQTFRLESGLKMWQALWDFRHPDTPCFTAHVKPKPRSLWNRLEKSNKKQFGDVFLGRQPSSDESNVAKATLTSPVNTSPGELQSGQKSSQKSEEDWVSSPKDTVFPETIPEESSSTEEEHVVIFRLPSLSETEENDGNGTFYSNDPSIFQLSVSKGTITKTTIITPSSSENGAPKSRQKPLLLKTGSSTDSVSSRGKPSSLHKLQAALQPTDVSAASFLDVAVLRCLFMSQWPEEGLFWALQFYYHRLKAMSEETRCQHRPRRRSNSLPIPKIEISLYQSPDSKDKNSKDYIEIPDEKDSGHLVESPYFSRKQSESSAIPSRRSSEKKRRMKMADLRAFVETKLMSKSEKTLENIDHDDSTTLFQKKEHHLSLDTGEDKLIKTLSPATFEVPRTHLGWGRLVKVKSMPSLSCLVDEVVQRGLISDFEKSGRIKRLRDVHSYTVPNPIITVTEHSSDPSPEQPKKHLPFLLDETLPQVSIESHLDEISQMCQSSSLNANERKPSLTRSQTDSNITYTCEDIPEAPGASCFITHDGNIDIQVVLKAIHSVALRNNVSCTLRVCEVIFNLLELLVEMDVLKSKAFDEESPRSSVKDVSVSEPDVKENISPKSLHDKHLTAHNLVLNTLLRVYKHLGCPHGCNEGQRGPPAEFLRSQGQSLLMKLQKTNEKQFSKFLRDFVKNQHLQDVIEFFHAYLGFCVDPSSLLSPLRMNHLWLLARKAGKFHGKSSERETSSVSRVVLDQKRSSSKSPEGAGGSGGYANNFGQNLRGSGPRAVESHIINSIFKTLVSRFVKASKELKAHENMHLSCDVRQLMTYVKEAHGSVFRCVALSGLLDTAIRPNKEMTTQTTRVIRHVTQTDSEEQADQTHFVDERGQKRLLHKKKSTASTHGISEGEASEEAGKTASPIGHLKRRGQPTLTPRHSEKNLGVLAAMGPLRAAAVAAAAARNNEKQPKLKGIVNWFRKEHGRSGSIDNHDEMDLPEGAFQRHQSVYRGIGKMSSKGSSGDLKQAIQKTKKRVEDQFKKNFIFRKGKKKDNSLDENSGSYRSRRDSMDPGDPSRESDYVIFRERKLVPSIPLLNGMKRFAFLLETCQPGSVPDQHLLAALLDLPHAPVVGRAAVLLECAFFVHNLNKGQWPTWMKLNFPMFRPSMPSHTKVIPSGMRRTHIQQRSAGKLFYQWAEALGARLEEMLQDDKRRIPDVVALVTDESRQKELLKEDEEEDFLDESSVNPSGKDCPIALRMIACVLLLEITSFLRETYQALPKSSRGSGRDKPPGWDRMYSREANRRWSMALSSMGHSQASAQSLQSITGDAAGQNERKISFVLHEPDNESEGSSNTTVTMHGEDGEERAKKGRSSSTAPHRPLLLRRGTATNATGSFKRKSLKLRRGTKEGIEPDFKRADSIQSRRKKSSLSDRSDTSEPGAGGDVSGDESPGVLSDDHPESPSDSNEADDTSKNMPWLKVLVQVAHSFNFYCSHQNFCHPYCYRRQMRACGRLMKAVCTVYGEENEFVSTIETSLLDKDSKKDKGGRGRKSSDQPSPVKRKTSVGRKDRWDGSRHGGSDQDVEKNSSEIRVKGQTISEKKKDPLPILKYLKTQVRNVFHAPLSALVKGAVVLSEELFIDVIPVAWELLLETDQEVAASAASLFILCAVRAPNHASDVMLHALSNQDVSTRINAILRFQVLWKQRYQVWPRMEEGAHLTFKVPPPGIEFTLPSPKIGIESLPVVDPPWIPQVQTKMEEVTISQESHRSLVTATKTRKKQQTELITMALQAQEDKRRTERENFLITTIPITEQAAYQLTQVHAVGDDHDEGDEDQSDMATGRQTHHTNAIHSLFPSCLCSSVIQIITLLDDCAVSPDGTAVYEVAYSVANETQYVTWNCLVEDSPLFLRYILERITREKQDQMFKILRHLIRFVPKLPQQAAFSLYNYIIGYVMFYVRSSHEEGQEMIGTALSVLWMVVHSVHGIMFKDLKQILRKEQCDASILLTANVPSAKKIVVHGPQEQDSGGIPSQFPVQEDTQFCQILRESLDFFGIEEAKHNEYFLVDHKTRQIHNAQSYVRDFYFFKRSQYPQLELVYMKPDEAFLQLQKQELLHKFVEIGKVLLTWAILKNVDMVVQRVVFLHEELMKLPSFPRKALESDLDLYSGGELGKELLGLDVLHKFMWVRLIARMFEAMAGNYSYSGDIHLFLNVLNGALILHSEDSCILRYVVATYINSAHNFKNIFSTNGYLLIMPTMLQIYSNHQTNKLVTRTIEYGVKQFYLMNRKPFILQMFGSLSSILDTDEEGQYGDAHKVQAKCLFKLLLSLETPSPDPLNIAELVREEKPLKAIDFCYHNEDEMVNVLDCISLCVMVVAYASDSVRGHQMLIILEAILPHYLKEIRKPGYEKDGKTEREIIQQLSAAIRTLVHNAEALAKNYNGPMTTSPEHKGSSQRNYSRGPYSPGFDFDDEGPSRYLSEHGRNMFLGGDMEDSELMRTEFRRPRDILLSLVSDFYTKCTARLAELPKKNGIDVKPVELLDIRSHVRLVDIAHSLLKAAPYDMEAMACAGLQRYMNQVLPYTDWSTDAMRPALITLLRRMDKLFCKIYKKPSVRRKCNWEAAAGVLKGVYETLYRFPYIVHMQSLKALICTCQALILGDCSNLDISGTESVMARAMMAQLPPSSFCSVVIKMVYLQILAMGESYSLENVCGGTSVYPEKKKTESMLLNLIIPLCMRVGAAMRDNPLMRLQDISFAITVILHSMSPPGNKQTQMTAQNIKSLAEMRSGQVPGREPKKPVRLPQSTYQVAFLALKIAIVTFEPDLTNDWPRIARTVREVGRIWDLGNVFWDFLDFIATYKTPLYVLLLPFLHEKVHSPPMNDSERQTQFVIREKLRGYTTGHIKCRTALLVDLSRELKDLKEELETGKPSEERTENLRSDPMSADYSAHARHHRPSLIGLLSEHLLQKRPSSDNAEAGQRYANETQLRPVQSQRTSVSSVNEKARDDDRTTADEFSSLAKSTSAAPAASGKGETSVTAISPSSPGDESSSEKNGHGRHRLQRSKAQSRKTFRMRKSHRNRVGRLENIPCSEKVCYSTPATPSQVSVESPQEFLQKIKNEKEQLAKAAKEAEAKKKAEAGRRSHPGSFKVKLSPSAVPREAAAEVLPSRSGPYQPQRRTLALKSDLSFEDDTSNVSQTSSTSGYRESCSLVTMTLESPTLLRPSSAPMTTSPDSSLSTNGGEDETAVMARSSSSTHSLFMLDTQDEDTLI